MRQLKVYGVNLDGRHRGIVAATSMTAASRAFGIKLDHMKQYGGVTGNDEEVSLAMRRPGTVFKQHYSVGSPWVEVSNAHAR